MGKDLRRNLSGARACRRRVIFPRRNAPFSPVAEHGCTTRGRVRTWGSGAQGLGFSFARMPKPKVYVETTIPNFYYDRRSDSAIVDRRAWTREWWSDASTRYELMTGAPVLAELLAGITPWVAARLRLVGNLPLLIPDAFDAEIVRVYLRNKLMPAKPPEDALHLALASHHACDFIVTWNCKHLANPNKAGHVERINAGLGLHVPALVTPRDLLRRDE